MNFQQLFQLTLVTPLLEVSNRTIDIMSISTMERTRNLISYQVVGGNVIAVLIDKEERWADIGRLCIRRDGDMAMEVYGQLKFQKKDNVITSLELEPWEKEIAEPYKSIIVESLQNHFEEKRAAVELIK